MKVPLPGKPLPEQGQIGDDVVARGVRIPGFGRIRQMVVTLQRVQNPAYSCGPHSFFLTRKDDTRSPP